MGGNDHKGLSRHANKNRQSSEKFENFLNTVRKIFSFLNFLLIFSVPLLSFNNKVITVFTLLAGSSFSFQHSDWLIVLFGGFHENQQLDHKIRIHLSFSLTNFTHIYAKKAINHTFYQFTSR